MRHKTCKNCTYYREPMMAWLEGYWCSNSKSPNAGEYMQAGDACKQISVKDSQWDKFKARITTKAMNAAADVMYKLSDILRGYNERE